MSILQRSWSALLSLCLLACAGGGGGGTAAPVTPTPVVIPATIPPPAPPAPIGPTAGDFRTAEYNLLGALEQIHAADAYALGYTGAGVTIGIVDFNFNFASGEVRFHSASLGPDPTATAIYQIQAGGPTEPDPHGQAVAVTAAGLKNGSDTHGIAFDATVLAVDYFSGVNERQFTQGGALVHVSDPFTYITDRGVRVINYSLGYEAGDPSFPFTPGGEIYTVDSPARAVLNGALLVASAGNAGHSDPSLSNFDTIDDLQRLGILNSGAGAFIIAGAVDAGNQIASFSDKAGSLRDHYMVAPGVRLTLPWSSPGCLGPLCLLSGTSFAAPLISGTAAIILQRWPQLTARQVMQILFDSATDLGAPGVDAVYGHGLLNAAAALQPNGITTFSTGDGATALVSGTAIALGPAFGDAPAFREALAAMTMFDHYGRDFAVDFSGGALPWRGTDLYGVMLQALGWHGSGFRLGTATSFAFQMRGDPADGLTPFGFHGGPETNISHDAVFRFTGSGGGMNWSAGTGMSLHDALTPTDAADPFANISLTQGFTPGTGIAPGAFATGSLLIGDRTALTFGVLRSLSLSSPYRARIPFRNESQTAAARLDHVEWGVRFGFEVGASLEEGGLLGSMAAGGLKMADRASTAWGTLSAQTEILPHWSLKGVFTAAATAATTPAASLIDSIGPIYSTSFALGLARPNAFGAGDALSFTVSQPLRAEQADMVLLSGIARDASGAMTLARRETSLQPSGRELDFETGYRFPLGEWTGGANLAYSLDAGQVHGQQAASALLWVSRTF